MNPSKEILSFMDLLDLDEEMVDTRLKSIMVRETYTNKHLNNAIQLLQYKQLINLQDGTDCDNEDECTFVVKLINQVNHENVINVCKIASITLNLNCTTVVNKTEHLLQQILSDLNITSEKTTQEPSALLALKLCDTMLETVIKIGEKLTLPFLEIPVSRILHHSDEKLRIHFLTSTVPKLFEAVQGYSILDVIWNIIIEIPEENNELALKILSCLSEFYIPIPDKDGKVLFQSEVVYQLEFWKVILRCLRGNDRMNRKLSMYLGKRAIDCLMTGNRDVILKANNKIFSWNSKKADILKNEWDYFFILMDSLEEKQSNIVLPSLHLFEKLKNLEECWLICPFNLGLKHDNTMVKLKTVMYKMDTSLKSLDEAVSLLEALNDNNIFDDTTGFEVLKAKMKNFFSNQTVLIHIIKALIVVKWSPVPLYHVTEVITELSLKYFQLENLPQMINEILKIPCNNVLIRKAVHTNILYFIENCCDLHWKELLSILPQFQVKLPVDKIMMLMTKNLGAEKEKIEFLRAATKYNNSFENSELVILYLKQQSQDVSYLFEILNERVRKIQDIVNRQYSDKKECLTYAVSVATLYSTTKNIDSQVTKILHKTVAQEMKLILQYFLSLISSDINFNIDEIILISKVLETLDCDDSNEILLQLYKISLLLFTDKRSDLDKVVLGLFNVYSLKKNTVFSTNYKHEMISIKHLLGISLDKKQDSRLVNTFYEKLSEFVFKVINDDEKYVNAKEILEFVEKVTESGGYGCLYWNLKIMNKILPTLFNKENIKFDITQFVHRMWKEIEELKSNYQYGPCMEEFINLVMLDCLLDHPMYNNVVTLYCTRIIENAAVRNTSLYYLVRKLGNIELNINRGHLIYILCEVLMYSPVPRKDQRITDNLMIDILWNPKYEAPRIDTAIHFNFQIQYLAISILSNINHPEIYQTVTSYITNKIDVIFKNKQRYHGNSQAHRTLLIGLQHLLYISSLQPSLDVEVVRDWLVGLLARLPHQPSVRLCLEWLISLFYYRKNVEFNQNFIEHLDHKKVPLTSQFIVIYYIMKRKLKKNYSEREYHFVLNHLLANTMGPLYNVRLYAQCISKQLYALKESPEHRYMVDVVKQNCAKDKNCMKLEEDFFITRFDIESELRPSFVYFFVPNYTEKRNEKIYVEFIREELKIMSRNDDGQLSDDEVFNFDYPKSQTKTIESIDGNGSIQKKYVPWRNMSEVDVYGVTEKESPSELIVVASLIDKLPNLGGMARTSEVFGVDTYVVDSLRHLKDAQFQALSVSAERWVNIEEVRPGAPLKLYLNSKKLEGYSIVAAEQTSTSCRLDKFKFPKKTVLLLGHEKEGIPCDLLPLMDHCVEVPQQGVVRSLNVHVTAAIFIWEYSRQHILS